MSIVYWHKLGNFFFEMCDDSDLSMGRKGNRRMNSSLKGIWEQTMGTWAIKLLFVKDVLVKSTDLSRYNPPCIKVMGLVTLNDIICNGLYQLNHINISIVHPTLMFCEKLISKEDNYMFMLFKMHLHVYVVNTYLDVITLCRMTMRKCKTRTFTGIIRQSSTMQITKLWLQSHDLYQTNKVLIYSLGWACY